MSYANIQFIEASKTGFHMKHYTYNSLFITLRVTLPSWVWLLKYGILLTSKIWYILLTLFTPMDLKNTELQKDCYVYKNYRYYNNPPGVFVSCFSNLLLSPISLTLNSCIIMHGLDLNLIHIALKMAKTP